MNLYFLVEGEETEMQVYSRWIEYLLGFRRVQTPQEAVDKNYYLVCGYGYPNTVKNELRNAIATINDNPGKFHHLVLCLDSDESSIQERLQYVDDVINENNLLLEQSCFLTTIVQHRCIETWFLGNKAVYSRQPNTPDFIEFARYYSVHDNDPESMGKHRFRNHAHFHEKYLRAMFAEKNLHYHKNNPRVVCQPSYIEQLQKRVSEPEAHLQSLKKFFDFCISVKASITP
ncbi:MAG: hypothetical protein ACOVSW_01825 [Candidatus Kapaibacteriota bacterium]|jgi:hypothetical protein